MAAMAAMSVADRSDPSIGVAQREHTGDSNESLSFTLHHREGDGEVDVSVDDDESPETGPEDPTAPLRFRFSWRKLFRFMGPGWLMSLAYLDPGNLESNLQQGSYVGFSIVWVLWWSTAVGLILQELSARLGVVTGRDLAQTLRSEYPKWLTFVIYVNMELAVIASDIQEVVGSGIAINLLTNGRVAVWIGCVITGMDTFTFLAVHYLGVRYLEAFIFVLIGTMTVCFFVNWTESHTDVGDLLKGWAVPTLKSYAVTQAVGTIGAVIMPHNLYLHSGLVLSRKIQRSSRSRVNEAIHYNGIESALALLCSFFINLAIVATNAGHFYSPACAEDPNGPFACLSETAYNSQDRGGGEGLPCTASGGDVGKCGEIGLAGEGFALESGIGRSALLIWALGLLAAGQAATMTCTYAGQVIMGGCLQIELAPWKRVALTRVLALGPSLVVAVMAIGNSNLFSELNEGLNVLQSFQLPFAMLPVLYFTAQKRIMGEFRSRAAMLAVNVSLAGVVMIINFFLIAQFSADFSRPGLAVLGVYLIIYVFVCLCMLFPQFVSRAPRPRQQRDAAFLQTS